MHEQDSLLELTKANVATWDERAIIHFHDKTGFYAVERFRQGEDIIFPIESEEIGCVKNKSLLHLQCHIGLETLCFARRGAHVCGLDFSAESIKAARSLALDAAITNADFVHADIYDAALALSKSFDIIYISWGSLNWLPDLKRWGEIIAKLLAPSGFVYIIEQHPALSIMKEYDGQMVPSFSFRTPRERPIISDMPTSYNEDAATLQHTRIYEWDHPLSDIINALLKPGLKLEFLHEHETIAWRRLPMMIPAGNRLYKLPSHHVAMPLAFSLKARA
jgi:SAM-dependent methyltransferase